MKRIVVFIFVLLLFSLPVSAEGTDAEEFYREQYEISGAEELREALPDDVREYMEQNGIDPSDSGWVNSFKSTNVFEHIWEFIRSGAKAPLAGGGAILAIILISSAISSFDVKGGAAAASLYATALASAAIIAAPVFSVITAGVNAMKGSAVFMTSFIPVFAVIVAAGGGAVTSVSMSSLLLGAVQAVNFITSFWVMPLMGGYMAISLASSVSPIVSRTGIADGIKKLSFWIMSLITTVFVGILSIQTAVNSAADTVALRTVKFIVGSSVPVAGTALSEALTTVTASIGLLKASVGIYGVVAIGLIFLPLIAELLVWRVVLILNTCVSELFSLPKISGLLKSVDTVMSVLIGLLLLTGAMFIISLTVVVTTGKTG